MAFNFPNTPADGAVFIPISGGPVYSWSAATGAWKLVSGGSNAGVYIGDDPPAAPVVGQLWWESDSGNTYIWYSDGTSNQWVQFNSGTPLSPATALSRNHIVNPAMLVSQENGTNSLSTNSQYPADQWRYEFGGPPNPSTALTTAAGMANCVRQWSGTGGLATPTTTQLAMLYQIIEGVEAVDFYWGSAAAIPVVLRFKAKLTYSGSFTFGVAVRNASGARSFVRNFTVSSLSYQDFVMPIPACLDGAWPTDTNATMTVAFVTMAGPTYTAPVSGGWQNGNYLAAPGVGNLYSVGSQGFDIASVGIYADPNNTGLPPPFQVPDFAAELTRCQRYYERTDGALLVTTSNTNQRSWQTEKRIAPTIAVTNIQGGTGAAITTSTAGWYQNFAHSIPSLATVSGNARM